ncbi:MAG TPA: TolC family protein, partial [Candidatus Omnitrophota bacterium]|nr:TolC family protein [Candidatus Omnitrophota bacterium]
MQTIKQISIYKIGFLLLAVSLISLPLAMAQERIKDSIKLDIQKAIAMSFAASENLKISENAIFRNQSKQKEELSDGLPQITGVVGWTDNFEYPDIATTAALKEYSADSGVALSQTVFTFGKISNAVSAAQKAVDASRFYKESTEQDIIYDTKASYYNTFFAGRILEIVEQSYKNAQQNKKILEDRSSQGRVSKYDNIKISSDISSRLP